MAHVPWWAGCESVNSRGHQPLRRQSAISGGTLRAVVKPVLYENGELVGLDPDREDLIITNEFWSGAKDAGTP